MTVLSKFFTAVARRLALSGHGRKVARNLMERAQTRAGNSPADARELRRAALAYLSVLR